MYNASRTHTVFTVSNQFENYGIGTLHLFASVLKYTSLFTRLPHNFQLITQCGHIVIQNRLATVAVVFSASLFIKIMGTVASVLKMKRRTTNQNKIATTTTGAAAVTATQPHQQQQTRPQQLVSLLLKTDKFVRFTVRTAH